jgi:hypothetical protein
MPVAIDSPSCQRALIAVGPVSQVRVPRPIQRTATFLTQLIANAGQLPQTRARRRAEPAEAIAAYRETIAKLHAPTGQLF